MNCSIATDSQIANISRVLSKDVTGVSDNIVKVNGLSNAQCKYVQLIVVKYQSLILKVLHLVIIISEVLLVKSTNFVICVQMF